ncbi:hypothetical protein SADUNF_Sadunf08G0017500 [Salix dunnii]|uniref:Uncharacterized protein n=1 Tax=Salix dunnii TaxID=1413687 RepID=A0A835JWH7_9ROSI|nr:hypothetical protein SADUNF_Sadunf08G0017500 [Salix dunnii]
MPWRQNVWAQFFLSPSNPVIFKNPSSPQPTQPPPLFVPLRISKRTHPRFILFAQTSNNPTQEPRETAREMINESSDNSGGAAEVAFVLRFLLLNFTFTG